MAGKRSPTSHRTPEQIRKHYADYQGTQEQIDKRSQRNKARRIVEKSQGKNALAGKDVDHKRPIASGGGNALSNLRIQSVKSNRGWERKKGSRP